MANVLPSGTNDAPPAGPAGGDLSGSYPNPTVSTVGGLKVGRPQAYLNAAGVLCETANPGTYADAPSPVSQEADGILFGLLAGDVVTGIVLRINVPAAGTSPTTARFGLADSTGKIVVLSGNLNAAANWAAGAQKFPFTAPYTVPATGGYFGCFVVNGTWGTTQPNALQVNSFSSAKSALAGAASPGFSVSAQADLPAVGSSLVTTGGLANWWYMGLY